MREPLDGDGLQVGIGKDDLLVTARRGVAFVSRFHVVAQEFPHSRQAAQELHETLLGGGVGTIRLPDAEALADFRFQPVGDGAYAMRRDAGEVVRVDRLLVVKAGKEKLQEILADGGDRPLGGKIGAVDIVDAADFAVGSKNLPRDAFQSLIHDRAYYKPKNRLTRSGPTGNQGAFLRSSFP